MVCLLAAKRYTIPLFPAGPCLEGFPTARLLLPRDLGGLTVATEAAMAALDDIFERRKLERVISIAQPANVASTRIMEKIGLAFEQEFMSEGVRLVQYATNREQYALRVSKRDGTW